MMAETPGQCPFCKSGLSYQVAEIDGWIAAVACRGCDMRGPSSQFKYDDVEDAKAAGLARWEAAQSRIDRKLVIAVEDAINEPAKGWDVEPIEVGDYRHRLYRIWEPLCRAILPNLREPRAHMLAGRDPPYLSAPDFDYRREERASINGCLFLRADFAAKHYGGGA
jgi:hypothetical protein